MTEKFTDSTPAINAEDFSNQDNLYTSDRKLEGLASDKLRGLPDKKLPGRLDKFPPTLQKYLIRQNPDIFRDANSRLEQTYNFYQGDSDYIEYLKQPSLVPLLVVDIANCIREILAAAKVPITKYDLDLSTWTDQEDKPPKLIIKKTEHDELYMQYKRIRKMLEDIKGTKFDKACITGMNWQSAEDNTDYCDDYNALKHNLAPLLECYAAYKQAALHSCIVQKKEDIEEHSRLLPYQHLISALAQRFHDFNAVTNYGLRISSAEESEFYAVAQIVLDCVKEILYEEYKIESKRGPSLTELIEKHLAECKNMQVQQL